MRGHSPERCRESTGLLHERRRRLQCGSAEDRERRTRRGLRRRRRVVVGAAIRGRSRRAVACTSLSWYRRGAGARSTPTTTRPPRRSPTLAAPRNAAGPDGPRPARQCLPPGRGRQLCGSTSRSRRDQPAREPRSALRDGAAAHATKPRLSLSVPRHCNRSTLAAGASVVTYRPGSHRALVGLGLDLDSGDSPSPCTPLGRLHDSFVISTRGMSGPWFESG